MKAVEDASREKTRISELESINTQMRWWRWGTFGFVTVFLIACLLILNSSVRGLTTPGHTQDEFVQNVSSSLQNDTMPLLEHEATETLTEIQPEVKESVLKLKDQVPEIAQTAEDQVHQLQQDLPAKSQDILNKKFGTLVASREAQIKASFPDATPEKLTALVTNLAEHAKAQLSDANYDLFGPHQAKLQHILVNMDKIRTQEAKKVQNEQPEWEMGVLLLDVFRDDLHNLSQPTKQSKKSTEKLAERSEIKEKA